MPRLKDPKPENHLIQFSVRLPAGDLEELREMSDEREVPQSEIIRAAIKLYRHSRMLDRHRKLAIIDLENPKPRGYYKVDTFIISESD